TFDPTQFLQTLNEHRNAVLCHLIVGIQRDEHTDASHAPALLRARRQRPRCCAAEQRDETVPRAHSITSSARASSVGGTATQSAFAVVRLITISNLVGC